MHKQAHAREHSPRKIFKLGALRSFWWHFCTRMPLVRLEYYHCLPQYTSVILRYFGHCSQPCTCHAYLLDHWLTEQEQFYFVLHFWLKQSQRSPPHLTAWREGTMWYVIVSRWGNAHGNRCMHEGVKQSVLSICQSVCLVSLSVQWKILKSAHSLG